MAQRFDNDTVSLILVRVRRLERERTTYRTLLAFLASSLALLLLSAQSQPASNVPTSQPKELVCDVLRTKAIIVSDPKGDTRIAIGTAPHDYPFIRMFNSERGVVRVGVDIRSEEGAAIMKLRGPASRIGMGREITFCQSEDTGTLSLGGNPTEIMLGNLNPIDIMLFATKEAAGIALSEIGEKQPDGTRSSEPRASLSIDKRKNGRPMLLFLDSSQQAIWKAP